MFSVKHFRKNMEQKIRYDLTPQYGIEEVSKVFTNKLNKYNQNEWKYGMQWTEVLSSLKKHLSRFERGKDYTKSGMLEMAEVAANALILCEFYHIFPQGDDRIMAPICKPIVGLDLDNVVFDFNTAYCKRFGTDMSPYWSANYQMPEHLKELESDKEFWVNLPVLHRPQFEVNYYITARNIPEDWIRESLQKNGLPCAPVHTVPWDQSKLKLIQDLGINVMIDDRYENYKELTNAGIFCYLMDAPHNKYYDVGHRRIYNLNIPIK